MNPTSRAILHTVLTTDTALSELERGAIQRVLKGEFQPDGAPRRSGEGPLLVSQKLAAKMLGISRVTVWRLTKDCILHPVEILPGTWRYAYSEIEGLAKTGWRGLEGRPPAASRQTVMA